MYRSICSKYGLEAQGSRWTTPPKVGLPDPDRRLVGNSIGIVDIDKQYKMAVVIDVAIQIDRNIRKKQWEAQKLLRRH